MSNSSLVETIMGMFQPSHGILERVMAQFGGIDGLLGHPELVEYLIKSSPENAKKIFFEIRGKSNVGNIMINVIVAVMPICPADVLEMTPSLPTSVICQIIEQLPPEDAKKVFEVAYQKISSTQLVHAYCATLRQPKDRREFFLSTFTNFKQPLSPADRIEINIAFNNLVGIDKDTLLVTMSELQNEMVRKNDKPGRKNAKYILAKLFNEFSGDWGLFFQLFDSVDEYSSHLFKTLF